MINHQTKYGGCVRTRSFRSRVHTIPDPSQKPPFSRPDAPFLDTPPHSALASPTGPKFITSSEVMAILARLWHHEAPVLNLIFAASSPSALGLGAGQVSAVPALELAASTTYKMFFLSVLSVSPNKFRPPSKLGEDE